MIDHDCLMSWHDTILYVKENRLLLFHAINDGEMRNINFVICAIKNDIAFLSIPGQDRYIQEIYDDGSILLGKKKHGFQIVFNVDGTISIQNGNKFLSARPDRTVTMIENLGRWEHFRKGRREEVVIEIARKSIRQMESSMRKLSGSLMKITPRTELKFEVPIAEHCNLNCFGCDHFSPLAEADFADSLIMSRDFERLSELFHGRASEIVLLGGEPLLHPDIIDFLIMSRKNFQHAKIALLTNGILLLDLSEKFWEVCRDNSIEIRITKYPVKLDFSLMEYRAKKHHVAFRYFEDTDKVLKKMNKFPLDVEGNQDARQMFLSCHRSNQCIYLQRGRLWTCTVAPTVIHFDRFFGTHMFNENENSIDIYKAESGREILDFLSHPIPFCRHCKINGIERNIPWKRSERNPNEWV